MKKWALFLILASCKVSSFTTVVSPSLSFQSYKTFRLIEYSQQVNITQPEYDNPENRKLINQSIIEEMKSLGLSQNQAKSDIIVTYTLLIRDMVDTRIDSAVVYKPWVDTQQDSFNYTEGALTLVFIDDKTGNVLAQSQLESIMDRNPKKFESDIPKIIKKMFNRIENEINEHN
ncbi:hypothetical protein MNBD_BACTEROID06-967 [hydrothermal vent metagenome]|uniref:DUF4136 domain-containing protein n=1 Tax=hydrothermal vent metagenome TaxID=652676 RepID=A0A3B0U933_9ZZZZ